MASWASIVNLRPEKPSHLAKTIGPERLKQGGYLNIDKTQHSIDYTSFPVSSPGRLARTAFALDQEEEEEEEEEIHPVFRYSQWDAKTCSPADYEFLKPSLRLVTRFLEHPDVAFFFHGLLRRPLQVLETHPLLGELYTFRESQGGEDVGREGVAEEVWTKLVEMRGFVTLAVEEPRGGQWALAQADVANPFTRGDDGKHYLRSRIKLKPEFLSILRGEIKGKHFYAFEKHGLCEESRNARTIFYLAEVLLHEFSHSVSHVYFGRDAHTDTAVKIAEPFVYGNQRVAEVGHAFEQSILGGVFMPMSLPVHAAAPYGLCIRRFPGLMNHHGLRELSRGSPRKWGVECEYIYPVHMNYVAQFFEKRFWDDVVTRFGGGSFRYCRKGDFRMEYRPPSGTGGFLSGETEDVVVDGDEPVHD